MSLLSTLFFLSNENIVFLCSTNMQQPLFMSASLPKTSHTHFNLEREKVRGMLAWLRFLSKHLQVCLPQQDLLQLLPTMKSNQWSQQLENSQKHVVYTPYRCKTRMLGISSLRLKNPKNLIIPKRYKNNLQILAENNSKSIRKGSQIKSRENTTFCPQKL